MEQTHYEKYKETIKRVTREYYQKPENKEKKKAYMREYNKRNREALQELKKLKSV
jgi:hypothetical protein